LSLLALCLRFVYEDHKLTQNINTKVIKLQNKLFSKKRIILKKSSRDIESAILLPCLWPDSILKPVYHM